ncbi:hypothetical protein A3J20_04100 [Candidatus Gottesmanbacteria bacterium RIFCSPLOWO2_02_FULL_42_29]|uniref:PARP catalytic domain-containing protein n=1 Tax=Candidatus Gottesmanbacteria bacterium RIFCSPLOWO2_01_FULL_42_22 TaxID=1798391 RepID=A0A1F6BH26_9BACT|nr:MAG: hypothetical protein A2781_06325 [Candidatus Gottesmanbacteria bacterium RIFCSPHIGHO2_01_FULL_42_27]OGG34351.1 MAG: hypothetical protein A3G68_06740 [Candidatus Gottesmanbacteria bacterium RIFCSPLOWO2_12_FULL_42_10]OGG36210.1 MAG: hypothetical protein A2968_02270 [Candidatus Gottesmanbacteria bacterium RIFCSPLOWO2_01_FULL_42_22]OGG36367.1 MAG: hypothetical protein A3J20_04100 [Candidatus Gottesmanbacteria bacterium RIFCSPLOWO2_02_FULL_42_29]
MEKPPINPVDKVELPKAEQSVEHFSLSGQEKNIQEVFKLSPELENIALEATKSGETISLYRIENKNIEKEPDGITSHKDLKGQWFSPDLETALVYLRKSQQTFGTEAKRIEGANLVVVKIPKEEFEKLHVSKHPIASQMDVENDNYIVPESIERNYISLDNVQDKVGNFENLQKAKEQIKEKVKQFESKEAVELYEKYLENTFPSHEQNILWHGSSSEKFEGEIKMNERDSGWFGNGFYLSSVPEYGQRWGKNLHPMIIPMGKYAEVKSIKNNLEFSGDSEKANNEAGGTEAWILNEHEYSKKFTETLKQMGNAGVKVEVDGFKDGEVVVFNPSQIHILGSEGDIKKFKEFVSKNENKKDRQSVEEFLKGQGLEKVPNIKTNFLFHQHATTEDGKKVAERLDGTDILIQENAGWDEERLQTWQKVSRGEFTPEQAIEHEKQRGKEFFWKDYFTAIFEKLYGTNKEVLLVDLKNDDELYQEIYEFMKGNSAYNDLVNRESSYEETLERISNVSELESLMQKERENKILENIKTNLLELLKEKPELQNRENLKILFPMGAFHTRLYHEMQKQGDDVKREFSPTPYIFDPRQSVERKIHFKGIEEAQGDMPKILLYWLLRKIDIPHNFISHQRIGLFSPNQISEFFEIYKKSESDEIFKSEGQKYFNSIVQISKSKN